MKKKFHGLTNKVAAFFGERTNFGVEHLSEEAKDYIQEQELNWIYPLLPYETYNDQGYFQNKNSYGFVLESVCLVGSESKIAKDLASICQDLLPVGSNLQVMLLASNKVGKFLDNWAKATESENHMIAKLAQHRKRFFEKLTKDGKKPARTFRVIWSYSKKGKISGKSDEIKLLALKEQMMSLLEGIGLEAFAWDPEDLLLTIEELLYPNNKLSISPNQYNPLDSISKQIINPGKKWDVTSDHIEIDDWLIKSYSAKRYPFRWDQNVMQSLIGDPFNDLRQINSPFMVHLGINILPESVKTTKLAKATRVESQANTPLGKFLPQIRKEADEWGFVRQKLEEGERFVSVSYSVTLFSEKNSSLANEQKLFSIYRSNGWELQYDRYIQLPIFLSSLPMNWGCGWYHELTKFSRAKTCLSYEPSNIMPIQGEWVGTKTPAMLLTGRRGQLFNWSPFDNKAGNFNTSVVGSSGSGKSVFMQELMISTLRLGGRAFVLDVGRSFEKACLLLNGSFVSFSHSDPICINPFSTIPHDETKAQESLSFFQPVLAMMAAPQSGTTDKQNAILQKALFDVWNKHKHQTTISLIAKRLLEENDLVAKDLGMMLFPYTREGVYGRFFEGENTVDLTNKLVVIELEELKERKDLQAVIIQMMIINISNQMLRGERKIKFNIVFDEAWDMLRGKTTGKFINSLVRTLRKYDGGLIVGTQSVNDFYVNPGAQAAFDNSDWLCMLKQKKESIAALKKTDRIIMDQGVEQVLGSIKTKGGEYAEFLLMGSMGNIVGRLKLDPFSLMLYSTKAQDYTEVKDLISQGYSVEKAIEKILQERRG